MTPDRLTPQQHERLQRLLSLLRPGASMAIVAAELGITPGRLCIFLQRMGLGWPLSRERVETVLALPVVTPPKGRARKPDWRRALSAKALGDTYPDDPCLTREEVWARRDAARRARQAHEQGWLLREAARYGLPQMGRPVSGMVA